MPIARPGAAFYASIGDEDFEAWGGQLRIDYAASDTRPDPHGSCPPTMDLDLMRGAASRGPQRPSIASGHSMLTARAATPGSSTLCCCRGVSLSDVGQAIADGNLVLQYSETA